MKKIIALALVGLSLAFAHPALAAKAGSHTATKSVQVKGYKTKSGKVVAPHTRTVKVKTATKSVHVKGYTTKSGKKVPAHTRTVTVKHSAKK